MIRVFRLQDEPLGRSLNLAYNPKLDKMVLRDIQQGCSVMARDTANNNQIVGVNVNWIQKPNEPEEEVEEINAIMDRFFKFVMTQFDPWKEFSHIDSLLDCKLVAVHKEYRGQNICRKLVEFTFDFMRRQKIPLATVFVTGKFSRDVMDRMGYNPVYELLYEDYKVDGKQVFYPEEIHKGCAVMLKWV